MGTTLDLDEFLGSLIEVKKAGHVVYALRTDVSARVLLAAFSLRTLAQRLNAAPDDLSPEQQVSYDEQAVEEYLSDVATVCLHIVRHTYPEETLESLNAKLSDTEQLRIISAFFTRRSPESSLPPEATSETSSASESTTTTNRASRRAAAAHRR